MSIAYSHTHTHVHTHKHTHTRTLMHALTHTNSDFMYVAVSKIG